MKLIARKLICVTTAAVALCATAGAQIPDLLTAFDAGGRAMGLGGATYVTDASTYSVNANPAGLGFIREPMFGVGFRNMPQSRNVISGDFNDPDFETDYEAGSYSHSHVGYVFPMGRGALGLSYTRSGFIRDSRIGDGLADGALTVRNYSELTRAKTDLFTVSYGTGTEDGSTNYGFGIVFAQQYVQNNLDYDLFDGNNPVGNVSVDNAGTGNGVGLVAGVLFTPTSSPNTSFGLSAQSPISISGNSETEGYYDRIPGRFTAGFASRIDSDNGGYTLYGLQVSWFYGGESDKILARDDYAVFGGGVEYGIRRWGGLVPVRFGYVSAQSGGTGFIDRDSITIGLGYRPDGGSSSYNLSLAKPVDGTELDIAFSVTRYLGKK